MDDDKAKKVLEEIETDFNEEDYAVLENITEFCPVGCSECYKGVLTRLGMSALADIDPKYAELKRELNLASSLITN